jgi:zinc-ribbon domain
VAGFCSKCGAPLSPGMQLCPACGAPSATVAAVAPPAPQAAMPPKSGSSALKIVLIIVAVFVGLGVLSAGAFGFFVWRVAHSFHVSGSGNDVAVNIPGGKFSANTAESFSSSELGTDVYPGAQSGKGGMRMSLPTGTMVSAVYITPDSKDQVLAFYKGKFGSNVSTFDTVSGSVLTVNKSQQESVVVTITTSPSEYEGKTQIHIVHTTTVKSS